MSTFINNETLDEEKTEGPKKKDNTVNKKSQVNKWTK